MKTIYKLLVIFLTLGSIALADKYTIDDVHSSVEFKIKHLVISTVTGRFNDFYSSMDYDPKTKKISNLVGDVKVRSIDTANEKRDKHLRSDDFFNAKKSRTMTIRSNKTQKC